VGPRVQPVDDYEALPECVRMLYTREQWLWLDDREKAQLVQNETEPEF
jgi:hypothetical protein